MAEIVVTDEAVEAAARSLQCAPLIAEGLTPTPWVDEPEEVRGLYRRDARVTLEAAAPLLQVQASAEHGVCNACGWEGDAEHDVCPKCGQDELNYYFTPGGAPTSVQVDREALSHEISQHRKVPGETLASGPGCSCGGWGKERWSEHLADRVLALLSPEATK